MSSNTKNNWDNVPEEQIPITAGNYVPGLPDPRLEQKETVVWDLVNKLPRWAALAFAARCAYRIAPLVIKYIPRLDLELDRAELERWHWEYMQERLGASDGNEKGSEADSSLIEWAVASASQAAANAQISSETADIPLLAARCFTSDMRRGPREFDHVFYNVAMATHVATHATGTLSGALRYIEHAVRDTYSTFLSRSGDHNALVLSAIVMDLKRVATLSATQRWTDDTAVSQDSFGPIWPGKVPIWWKDAEEHRK